MTAYWYTLAFVCAFLIIAYLADPNYNQRPFGSAPRRSVSALAILSAGTILVGVGALRWGVGTDYFTYVALYETYRDTFLDSLTHFDEPLLKGIAWLSAQVNATPSLYIAIAFVITASLILRVYAKYSLAIGTSFLLFVLTGIWHGSFNVVRQLLAVAIILAGHRFIIERKIRSYLFIILLAAAAHMSAFIAIALYFVPRRRLSSVSLGWILIATIVGSQLFVPILELIDSFRDNFEFTGEESYALRQIHPLRLAAAVAPALLYFGTKRWHQDPEPKTSYMWFYQNMVILNAALMLITWTSPYLARFSSYVGVFLPLSLPVLLDVPDRRLRHVLTFGVVLLYGIFWFVEVSGSVDLNPFRWVYLNE